MRANPSTETVLLSAWYRSVQRLAHHCPPLTSLALGLFLVSCGGIPSVTQDNRPTAAESSDAQSTSAESKAAEPKIAEPAAYRPTTRGGTIRASIGVRIPTRASAQDPNTQTAPPKQNNTIRQNVWARKRERLHSNDQIEIHVEPKETIPLFVYVVHTDGQTATLLHPTDGDASIYKPTVFPRQPPHHYRVSGPKEWFTIVCTKEPLKRIADTFASEASASGYVQSPHAEWAKLEGQLKEEGKLDLSEESEKPFGIAGSQRASLPIHTGNNSIVLRQYAFRVK